MTAAKPIEQITIEDYLAGELVSRTKHEYLGGYAYAMAGARNVHNVIASAWLGMLYGQLRGKPCRPYNSDTKVRVKSPSQTRFYYPDGMVVCDPNPAADSFQDKPIVIAEVLSPSTRRIDTGEKCDAYLTIPSLTAYLVIETDRPRVVAHRRDEEGIDCEVYHGMDAVVPLPTIGAEIPLAELYEGVDFS